MNETKIENKYIGEFVDILKLKTAITDGINCLRSLFFQKLYKK